jgi:hypothetical protein
MSAELQTDLKPQEVVTAYLEREVELLHASMSGEERIEHRERIDTLLEELFALGQTAVEATTTL